MANKTKHTPGPLIANGNSIEEDKRRGARLLGSAYHDVPDVTEAEILANARLWAASPELLAACEALCSVETRCLAYREPAPNKSCGCRACEAVRAARAAVEKAKG